MYYTLKDMVRQTGLNERTVPKYLERYAQRTRTPLVEPEQVGRYWQYSEEALAAVLAEKAHVEEERTRRIHAPYTRPTDTNEILARLEAVEAQLAALQKRAPYLFAPVARSEGQESLSASADITSYQPATYKPPVARPSASLDGAFPSSVRKRALWVEEHGGPGASWVRGWADVPTWRDEADAIASVRRRKHWHDWQPAGVVDDN